MILSVNRPSGYMETVIPDDQLMIHFTPWPGRLLSITSSASAPYLSVSAYLFLSLSSFICSSDVNWSIYRYLPIYKWLHETFYLYPW
jgi:hypothetical protein